MSELTTAATVRLVYERASSYCEYCQTNQRIIGQAMHVEHIIPGGGSDPSNLALSCANCNLSKAKATTAPDPQTGEITPIFNPRTQSWTEHFAWRENGQVIEGLTSVGRATVERLKMNQERIVIARKLWIALGVHPPIF